MFVLLNEKAFDQIDWVKLLDILHNMGVDWRDRRLIWSLYMGQSAYMQVLMGFQRHVGLEEVWDKVAACLH